MKRFALAGNPNSGKTTLFNALTGATAHVGNWPGVTVDRKEGAYKKLAEPIAIVDLPGIYSLSPYTPEEVVSRNYILDERPDCVIDIVDATNLERNLYLTTQILEIDVPVVIALNMMDEVAKLGATVDAEALESKLGVPVVEISALKENGIVELMERAYEACQKPRKGETVLRDGPLAHLIGDVRIALEGQQVANPLFHAIKLVEMDEIEAQMHKESAHMVEKFKAVFSDRIFGTDFEALVADSRYKYISENYSPAYSKGGEKSTVRVCKRGKNKGKLVDYGTRSDRIDRVLTHKIWGIPIFLVILFCVFHLTFSEHFLFLDRAVGEDFVSLRGTAFEGAFGEGAIVAPGTVLKNFTEMTAEWVTDAVRGWMSSSPEWVSGLICDGILGGLSAVISFIPQILMLFLFFAIMEDSGYMARVAFILDRIFRRFGVTGRAFIPMMMGFGCSIPAMINTRTLADEKERIATIRVIPFFTCQAKIPILTAIAGGILQMTGVDRVDLITYGMYVLGAVVAIIAMILMKSTTMKGDVPPFIMELPTYHAPQFRNVMAHLWDKVKHFVKKAFTIILASTILIWLFSHLSVNWRFLTDEEMTQSILASIGMLLRPLFTPLGFGSQLSSDWGWVFVVGAVTGLIAKENVIATFGTLAACIASSGAIGAASVESPVYAMVQASGIGVPGLIAFIAFNILTIPCFAAVATAKAELPSKKSFRNTLFFWLSASYVVGSSIYVVGLRWWACFIVLAFVSLVVALVVLNGRGKLRPLARRRASRE